MMMEMVLILVMMVMERPPPKPRRRGGEDGGDFPLLRGSRAARSDPFGRGRGFTTAATLINLRKNRATLFSGETKAWLKGEVETGPRCKRVGPMRPDSLAAWAMPIWPSWLLSSGSFSHDLSPQKIMVVHFPWFIWYPEGPKTSKRWKKREFPSSQKLNATNRDFVRKCRKSSKTCKNNNITMQITFQYDNVN
jgi:hypothetical protein